MSRYATIDLGSLPPPSAVETLSFDQIKAEMLRDFLTRYPEFTALLESDPAVKIIEAFAMRELVLRARVNAGVQSVLLATATGSNLDQLAANRGVARLEGESDSRLRKRVQMALEAYSTAGPRAAYEFFAYSESTDVADVTAISPEPGTVLISVLAASNSGISTPALIEQLRKALSAEDRRPLTDTVQVRPANITRYDITARLTIYEGPDQSIVRQAAVDGVTNYAQANGLLGRDITLASLYAALAVPGVQNARLLSPLADIVNDPTQVALVRAIDVQIAGVGE